MIKAYNDHLLRYGDHVQRLSKSDAFSNGPLRCFITFKLLTGVVVFGSEFASTPLT